MRVVFFLLVVCLLVGCTSDPSATASLTGTISILGTDDYSGVTVALYAPAYLDTTLVRINQEYPHIGVIINQETEFDHRLQSPVTYTQTDVTGNYQLNNIKPDKYNLALLKEGVSLKYIYDIILAEGENVQQRIELNPSIDMSTPITEPITFKSGVQYNFKHNTQILSPVIIEAGAILSIDKEKKVEFYDDVNTSETGSRWHLTTSSYLNELSITKPDSTDYFNSLIIKKHNNNQVVLQNGNVSFVSAGINIEPDNAVYSNIRAKNGFTHLYVSSENHHFANNLVTDFRQRVHAFYGSSIIEKNIFYKNLENMLLSENEALVQNNYFIDNLVAMRPFYGDIHISHNDFENNSYCVSTVASDPLIEYNDFFGSKQYCIQTHKYYTQAAYDFSKPLISNNNFFGNNVSISLIAKSNIYSQGYNYYSLNGLGVRSDILATNNYYKHLPIDDRIVDHNDFPNEPYDSPNYCPYNVIFEPYSARVVVNAGIQ